MMTVRQLGLGLEFFGQSWQDWGDHDEVGAVFTLPHVVDLILDMSGYSTHGGRRLATLRVLEPSCGRGAFAKRIAARLIQSESEHSEVIDWNSPELANALRAVDINAESLTIARSAVEAVLRGAGCPPKSARRLVSTWFNRADFLSHPWGSQFDLVVGNPPYVRIEQIPRRMLERFRREFMTVSNRADLYVPFFERGLQLLSDDGVLAYICSNRFTKNMYGAQLRRLISDHFRVRYYLNLEHAQPFEEEVSAYPAIFVIDRNRGAPTRAATLDDAGPDALCLLQRELTTPSSLSNVLSQFEQWYPNGSPWVSADSSELGELLQLGALPTLEQSAPGTRLGIGVATGADRVFILSGKCPDIEDSRQLPIALRKDITNQGINWSGHYLVNPFEDLDKCRLVDLREYPGLQRYLALHAERLLTRHVAKGHPDRWYRTIDRIWPRLQHDAKLLIPDIQRPDMATIGLDEHGQYYPHHNVYWITSASWNLQALKALLRSTFIVKQVRAYSVQMRGGSLRYQAQTLRKLRVPALASLSSDLVDRLASVASSEDQSEIDSIAQSAFRPDLLK